MNPKNAIGLKRVIAFFGMNSRSIFLVTGAVVVILDQFTKHWCISHLQPNVSREMLDHWLYFTLTFNKRGAFSLLPLPNMFFILIVTGLVAGLLFYALRFSHGLSAQIWIGLILGGGVGNLIDRFRFGAVVDFIDLRFWPVFNLADSAVSVAIAAIVFNALFRRS